MPKLSKNFLVITILGAIMATIIVAINFFIFIDQPTLFSSINLIAGLLFVLPILMSYYLEYRRKKEIEELFPIFLRDFVEVIRGGMTVPQAFKSLSKNEYKAMNPYVKRISAQLDWGIPIDKVLLAFSKSTESKFIARVISSVIESHRYGGNLAETFVTAAKKAIS